jgi:hypothetical protein
MKVMNKIVLTLGLFIALGSDGAEAMQSAAKSALGTSAAVDPRGKLWIVYAEGAASAATVYVSRLKTHGTWDTPIAVNATPEPVSSDGENRPKLAFDSRGGMYVTWTSPTSANFTGDIRFARSWDGGKRWTQPSVVHRDRQLITHRFESLLVDREGTIWVAWIDKRDLHAAQAAKRDYAGAAIYYAYSTDRGATWQGDRKLADHTCECCRIALTLDDNGRPAAMWRHVFEPSERDHAFALLTRDRPPAISRATFDRWNVDACPHHGPGLAFGRDGTRHAVWFNQIAGAGRVFYGQLTSDKPTRVKPLPEGASHADVAVAGKFVAVAWKRFDGEATRVESWLSSDGGQSFAPGPALATSGQSDQPRLVDANGDILLVWRRAEGVAVQRLLGTRAAKMTSVPASSKQPARAAPTAIQAFDRNTLQRIEREHRGQPFWLVLWDLECTYCMKSLSTIASVQRQHPGLKVVTITTDAIEHADAIKQRLMELGVESDAYAFAAGTPEALRHAIDPSWIGEKPRAYRYDASGKRTARTGVLSADELMLR